MKDVVIVGALRTPIGCFRGALAGHSAESGRESVNRTYRRSCICGG